MKKINNVCIIDDNTITVYGLKKILSSIVEYNTLSHYENGEEAYIYINDIYTKKETLPDVIFLDLNMPVMDGWEFLQAIIDLKIEKKIDIHIITSSISKQDVNKYKNYKKLTHHKLSYNNKPIDKPKLLSIISYL